jgi:hypothetical protein
LSSREYSFKLRGPDIRLLLEEFEENFMLIRRASWLLFFAIVPTVALAMPRPRPVDWVEHRITKRHTPLTAAPPPIAFKSFRSDNGFVLHKVRGPETIEVLLGSEMKGDFVADLEVEMAGPRELGVGSGGGTPVPYYGFRSSDGQKEAYFLLSTYGGLWNSLSLQIRREKEKLTARRDRVDQKGYQPEILDAGYVCFVMNDTSKLRIRHFSITPADAFAPKKRVSDILIE